MTDAVRLANYINGAWNKYSAEQVQLVVNPATAEVLGQTPLSAAAEVGRAAEAASRAFLEWRQVPAVERIQPLFKLQDLLTQEFETLSRWITMENGKTIGESRGEMRRAIENVEVACGIPMMMQGQFSEDIARGIDEYMIRQPLGVVAIIAPFNFPGMIPFWFLPYALATGNTVILKPSERCPMTMIKTFELMEQLGLPPGVVNLVNGGAEAVNAILDHPDVRAVSFVGSTPVARHVYSRAALNGKRVQAQGGAKNPILVLPDADVETATKIIVDSAYGNAGQRCLAASNLITVGEATDIYARSIAETASKRVIGYGLDDGVEMGPVISPESRQRIRGLIQQAADDGAEVLLDGREASAAGYEKGNFMSPTLLLGLPPDSTVAQTEIFGPVLSMMPVDTLDDAIALINSGKYGNMASVFTSSGADARRFRHEVQAGNIGINIGVAAPMAFFPFSGWKDSFFGSLHGQARHGLEFYTQTKVVVERWLKEWSRKF